MEQTDNTKTLENALAENERLRNRVSTLEGELNRIQEGINAAGYTVDQAVANFKYWKAYAENAKAQIKALLEQEPIAYCRSDDFENRDDFVATTKPHELYTVKLFADPVPAQQSPTSKHDGFAIVEAALKRVSSGNLAEAPFPLTGSDAKCWLSGAATAYQHALEMITPVQSPPVAVPDTVYCSNETTLKPEVKKHLESLIALRAEMQGEESRTQFHAWADEQGFCMDEVWSSVGEPFEDENTQLAWIIWQASRAVIGAQSPRITEQDAIEILKGFSKWEDFAGMVPTPEGFCKSKEGRALLDKLNGDQSE